MEYRKRKHPRLKDYDYGQNGCYFVTVCTKDKRPILAKAPVGRLALKPPKEGESLMELTEAGKIVEKYIRRIEAAYEHVKIDNYVIMPNHFHLLLSIVAPDTDGGMRASRPTLHTIVRSVKTMVTREMGASIWQSSYYDHIVRDEKGFQEIWEYIDENPLKWHEDELFMP